MITTGTIKPVRLGFSSPTGEDVFFWSLPVFFPFLSIFLYFQNIRILLSLSKPSNFLVTKITLKQILGCLVSPTLQTFCRLIFVHFVFTNSQLKLREITEFWDIGSSHRVWVSRYVQIRGISASNFANTLEDEFRISFNKVQTHVLFASKSFRELNYVPMIRTKSAFEISKVRQLDMLVDNSIIFPIFENCSVVHGSYVIQAENFIRNIPYDISGFDTFPQTNLLVNGTNIFKQETLSETRASSGLFVGSSSNWYHFLVEILPRAVLWRAQTSISTPVIVHSPLPTSITRILKEIGQMVPLEIRDSESVQVDSLIVAVDGRYKSQPDMMQITTGKNIFDGRNSDLALVRNWMESHFDPVISDYPERVFLARGINCLRPMTNFEEVREFLEDKGYQTVFPEMLSIENQIGLFRNAHSIIAEGGAALTNLIFCRNLRHFIHIEANPNKYVSNFWQQFAEYLHLPSSAVLGNPEYFLGQPTGRFKVTLNDLEMGLFEIS